MRFFEHLWYHHVLRGHLDDFGHCRCKIATPLPPTRQLHPTRPNEKHIPASLGAFASLTLPTSPPPIQFAIFLCTPLVSISIGVRCFRELQDEPRAKHVLVFTILALYVVAILVISANALLSGADD